MAMLDDDSNRTGQQEMAGQLPAYLRYPADQIDFGYEIDASNVIGAVHLRGRDGLTLAARVYE